MYLKQKKDDVILRAHRHCGDVLQK